MQKEIDWTNMQKDIDRTRFHDVTIFPWKSSPRKLCAIVNIGLPFPARRLSIIADHTASGANCCESARWQWIEWVRVVVSCAPHYVHFHFARFVTFVLCLLVKEAVTMNQQVYSETPGSDCPQRCGGLQRHVGWTCSQLRWIEEIGGFKKIREKWIPSGRRWMLNVIKNILQE